MIIHISDMFFVSYLSIFQFIFLHYHFCSLTLEFHESMFVFSEFLKYSRISTHWLWNICTIWLKFNGFTPDFDMCSKNNISTILAQDSLHIYLYTWTSDVHNVYYDHQVNMSLTNFFTQSSCEDQTFYVKNLNYIH